jgi:signal transduction histidine kinase
MASILIIEDDDLAREAISEGLRAGGYYPLECEDGQQGIELAREHLPDVILCDLNMPDMNGFEVLTTLRNTPETANIPFIFLTAYHDRASLREGMTLGADDYISKPFDNQELLRAIETRLQRQSTLAESYEQQMRTLRQNIVLAIPHELRSPLMGIIGYAELIAMDSESMTPPQVAEMANEIVRSSWRLHRVVENTLIYAQIELLASESERSAAIAAEVEHHPHALISDVVERLSYNYRRNVGLSVDRNVAIHANRDNFVKIVFELLDNALKFSDEGALVQVTVTVANGQFVVAIENEGRGMTADQLQNIGAYMQFERAVYEQQGLGMGLTIAKRLIELHKGRLYFNSIPDQKTTVYASFLLAE